LGRQGCLLNSLLFSCDFTFTVEKVKLSFSAAPSNEGPFIGLLRGMCAACPGWQASGLSSKAVDLSSLAFIG